MAGNGSRTRAARFAARRLAGSDSSEFLRWLPSRGMVVRLILCVSAAVLTVLCTAGWRPPFGYRLGYTPARDVRVGTAFSVVNELETGRRQDEAARSVPWVYVNDPAPLRDLPAAVEDELETLAAAGSLEELVQLDPRLRDDFGFVAESTPPAPAAPAAPPSEAPASPTADTKSQAPPPTPQELLEKQFHEFREKVSNSEIRREIRMAVEQAVTPLQQNGLLGAEQVQQLRSRDGNQDVISIRSKDPESPLREVPVGDVLLQAARSNTAPLAAPFSQQQGLRTVTDRIVRWLAKRLPPTLTYDNAATERARLAAREQVEPATDVHKLGDLIVPQGDPINGERLSSLELEYGHDVAQLTWVQRAERFVASLGMVLLLFLLCALHIVRNEPEIAQSLGRLAVLLALVVGTVAASNALDVELFYAEVVPLLITVMVLAIAYSLEFGLLMAFALSLVITQAIGGDLGRFVILVGTSATAVLSVGKVRSRTKLTAVGFYCGIAYFTLVWGMGILGDQTLNYILYDALRGLVWGLLAGLIVTGLLPFVERLFGVVTDISLLELTDVAHPLLQELVQRAPGTYNHSVTVATLAERAAERIGANGLLVRVGAYFHDIGKMLKPHYFIENQSDEGNRHDHLAPAMSTLIIIGHVKDGADLAREHHLPIPIVDFIEQHHGTTLVEYFYHGATQHKDELSYSNVQEAAFRYPGPKPRTQEAGVLMLADCVESASRTLSEPTPARIERLVEELGMKLLLDGQFDESGLDLKEIRDIQDSLIKSLTSVYHGRIKYPQQRTA